MATAIQSEHEVFRVIVLSPDGKDILVVPDGDRFVLPSVAIPRWQRVAENLAEVVKSGWGEEIVCLFELSELAGTHGTGIHYQVARHWGTAGVPKILTKWLPIATLSKNLWTDVTDQSAIQQSIAQRSTDGETSPGGPFTCLGWFDELREWIEEVIEPLGFQLNGRFRQLNASPTFSLIRFETDGPALWFKAVGEPNQREFPITCELSRLFPGYVPIVLGTRPEWNGWLTKEAAGNDMWAAREDAFWKKAAAALAQLQIESIDHCARVLQAGAHDLGVNVLSKMVRPFVEIATQLVEPGTTDPSTVFERKEMFLLGDRIEAALEALDALDIPETLGHLDLNPENIVVSDERCVFLDWTEGCIGNPIVNFQYLLEYSKREVDMGTDRSWLTEAYTEHWRALVSPEHLARGLALTPLLAAFAYAARTCEWRAKTIFQDSHTAKFLRSLVLRMRREADALPDRMALCAD